MINEHVIFHPEPLPNARICCCICLASSRVGVSISANIPYGSWDSSCRRGNANAAVLPLPVAERVRTWWWLSLLFVDDDDEVGCLSINGIIARWTAVGVLKPNLRHAWTRGADNPKSENLVVNADELRWWLGEVILLVLLSSLLGVDERFFLDDDCWELLLLLLRASTAELLVAAVAVRLRPDPKRLDMIVLLVNANLWPHTTRLLLWSLFLFFEDKRSQYIIIGWLWPRCTWVSKEFKTSSRPLYISATRSFGWELRIVMYF